MRLFVALAIPAQLRENLASLIGELRSADPYPKWVHPDHLHLTLKFIGEVAPEKLAEIGEALAVVRTQQSVIAQFREIGFFPDARRPGVAWVGVQSRRILYFLAEEVNRVLAPLGIPREEKPFAPHLTIARFKETRLSPALRAEIAERNASNFGTLTASEFHLIESKRKSTGAEYTTLRSFPFAPEECKGQER
jgi:2'-5' RNA ligase